MWAVTHDFEFSFSIGDLLKEVHGPQWSVYFENKLREDYNALKIYFPRLIAGFYPAKLSDFNDLLQSACKKIEDLSKNPPKNPNEQLRGPYSFLFFLTAFDLALERKGEFKEDNAEALMDMIELLLEMADYPESYVKVNNELREVFLWTADSAIPGFTTSLVANFALEHVYGSKGTDDKERITESYSRLNADSVEASRVSTFVCMFRKIQMSDILMALTENVCLPTLLREYLQSGNYGSLSRYLVGCEK